MVCNRKKKTHGSWNLACEVHGFYPHCFLLISINICRSPCIQENKINQEPTVVHPTKVANNKQDKTIPDDD